MSEVIAISITDGIAQSEHILEKFNQPEEGEE